MTELVVKLLDELAQRARSAGLVTDSAIQRRHEVETMIAGVLHIHDAKRWIQVASSAPAAKPKAQKAAAR